MMNNLGFYRRLTTSILLLTQTASVRAFSSGKNCTDKRIVKVPVNTTVTELESYFDYEDCFCLGSWDHPFQKKVAKVKYVTKTKLENVTKVINFDVCCEGWEEHEEKCFPTCHCDNGHVCHHVSGECLRCDDNAYGVNCQDVC